MIERDDLHDPGAVLVFRAHAASRGACEPPLDWLAWVFSQGRTLHEALQEAELTVEGRGWCAWCRQRMADVMAPEVREAFTRVAATGNAALALTWSRGGIDGLTDREQFFLLCQWHSGAGIVTERRRRLERMWALQ